MRNLFDDGSIKMIPFSGLWGCFFVDVVVFYYYFIIIILLLFLLVVAVES